MNEETIKISKVIKKSPDQRSRIELTEILPYLAKRSDLLQNLQKELPDVLFELIKCCRYQQFNKDEIIIKQGTIGDCFYIILTGHTSVYIDTSKADDKDDLAENAKSEEQSSLLEEIDRLKGKTPKPVENKADTFDRTTLGKFIMHIEAGKSFGEIALLSDNAERNASIVADMNSMDLLVVDRQLYDRTVKERQMMEYQDKRNFINSDPIFSSWITKFKRLLEMSLVKQTYTFDNTIVKQGEPVDGLYFIISGQAKIVVDPSSHAAQYPKLMSENNKQHKRHLAQSHIHIRRKHGYAESEKRLNHRLIDLAFLKPGDIFGILELSAHLPTYLGTLLCTSPVTILHINSKNYDRLVIKKNSRTHDYFVSTTHERITDMLQTKAGDLVPLFKKIYDKYIRVDENVVEEVKLKPKDKDDREFIQQHLLQLFAEGKMALVEPCVPDSVYFKYKSVERRNRALSARERVLKEQRDNSINNKLRTLAETRRRALSGNGRRARSRRELNNLTLNDFTASGPVINYQQSSSKPQLPSTADSINKSPSPTNLTISFQDQISTIIPLQPSPSSEKSNQSESIISSEPPETEVKVKPYRLSQSAPIRSQNSTESPSERAKTDHYLPTTGDDEVDPVRALFEVMETIEERKERHAMDLKLRPKSAPQLEANQHFDGNLSLSNNNGIYLAGVEDYFDKDTSNPVLSDLEHRLQQFHINLLARKEADDKPVVTHMRRYDIQNTTPPPVPGGTVLVKLKPCRYTSAAAENYEHSHTRRYILPKLHSFL